MVGCFVVVCGPAIRYYKAVAAHCSAAYNAAIRSILDGLDEVVFGGSGVETHSMRLYLAVLVETDDLCCLVWWFWRGDVAVLRLYVGVG